MRRSRRARSLPAVLLTIALVFSILTLPATPAQATAPTRADIVAIAQGEIGVSEANGQCTKYGPCLEHDWCAMFSNWVWEQAGVSPAPTTWVARDVGAWGVEHGVFKPRPSGQRGSPEPGDVVVYGEPANVVGGHTSIVAEVHSNGTITTIDGNFSNQVLARTIDPTTARAGAQNLLISGYVEPPNLAPPQPVGWTSIVGADLDGDGNDAVGFYRTVDGRLGWYGMTAQGQLGDRLEHFDISPTWDQIVAGDFDGDGDDELLFYRKADGRVQVYEMTDTGRLGGGAIASYDISPSWDEITAGDFNGDGRDQVLFYRNADGRVQVYDMTDTGRLDGGAIASYDISPSWDEIVAADLNGDGRDQVLFYRQQDGRIQVYHMTDTGRLDGGATESYDVSPTWTEIVSMGLDGDGDDEVGFYRNTDGRFNIYEMTDTGRLGERLSSLDLYPNN